MLDQNTIESLVSQMAAMTNAMNYLGDQINFSNLRYPYNQQETVCTIPGLQDLNIKLDKVITLLEGLTQK